MKHTYITSSCEFYRTFQGSQTYMICAYISKISNPYIALNLFRETYKYIFIFNHFWTLSCMMKVVMFILRWRQERTRYSLYVLTVAADGLATQGARTASAAMVGANLSRNIPVSAPEWFFFYLFEDYDSCTQRRFRCTESLASAGTSKMSEFARFSTDFMFPNLYHTYPHPKPVYTP